MFRKALEDDVAEKTVRHNAAENSRKEYNEAIDNETMIEIGKSQFILSRCSTWM
jgi:hypothetical protein